MQIPNEWIAVILTILILAIGFIGGYAVLRKRVADLEEHENENLTEEKHESLCKIATLEMKKHVSDTMKDTIDEFTKETFKPALHQLLKAINGD